MARLDLAPETSEEAQETATRWPDQSHLEARGIPLPQDLPVVPPREATETPEPVKDSPIEHDDEEEPDGCLLQEDEENAERDGPCQGHHCRSR